MEAAAYILNCRYDMQGKNSQEEEGVGKEQLPKNDKQLEEEEAEQAELYNDEYNPQIAGQLDRQEEVRCHLVLMTQALPVRNTECFIC